MISKSVQTCELSVTGMWRDKDGRWAEEWNFSVIEDCQNIWAAVLIISYLWIQIIPKRSDFKKQ